MPKKGRLNEIFSKAIHADNPESYTIGYLDYDIIKEKSLLDFMIESKNFEVIPASRIKFVKKGNRILFLKSTLKVS